MTPDTEEQVRGSAERKGGVSAPPRSGLPLEGKLFLRPSVKQAIASVAQSLFQGEIISCGRRERTPQRPFLISNNLLSRVAISSLMALISLANFIFSL